MGDGLAMNPHILHHTLKQCVIAMFAYMTDLGKVDLTNTVEFEVEGEGDCNFFSSQV